ncbi:hypothetical protein JCM1393_23640 [Clostridium carnis]
MKSTNKREHTKDNYLKNGVKTKESMSKNSFINTTEEPALNESGIEAKKRGF